MIASQADFAIALMARVCGVKRIARLMRAAGLVGASRRWTGVTTTRSDKDARSAPDLVDRNFVHPSRTSSGSPTSPSCRRRAGSSIWLLCWMPGAERSLAGLWPTTCVPNLCWVRSRWQSANADPAMSFITATREAIHIAGVRQALQRSRRAALDGFGRRRLRQRHVREFLRHARMRTARPPPLRIAS
jgi:hypothetical protein